MMKIETLIYFLIARGFELCVVVTLILFLPIVPPQAEVSTPFIVPSALPFEGVLALNDHLNSVELWHKSDLLGPRAFAEYNKEIYTVLLNGNVVKLVDENIVPVIKFGKPCKGIYPEKICGRPLALEFDKDGALYVADAYYGIFKVNITTGDRVKLIKGDEVVDKKRSRMICGLSLASNGDIFWIDASTEFELHDGSFALFADGSGRLVHYNATTKKNAVLIPNLRVPKSVRLTKDESTVLITETMLSRIIQYHLKGPKNGTHDVFIDRLPGLPDNIGVDGRGGYLVPLVVGADDNHPHLAQMFGPFPMIRRFVVKIFGLLKFAFKTVLTIYPSESIERIIHDIGQFSSPSPNIVDNRVTILHLSKTGKILDSLHGLNGKISAISDAFIFNSSLYLGSPFNDYIARVKLSEVGWEHLDLKHDENALCGGKLPADVTQQSTNQFCHAAKDGSKMLETAEHSFAMTETCTQPNVSVAQTLN